MGKYQLLTTLILKDLKPLVVIVRDLQHNLLLDLKLAFKVIKIYQIKSNRDRDWKGSALKAVPDAGTERLYFLSHVARRPGLCWFLLRLTSFPPNNQCTRPGWQGCVGLTHLPCEDKDAKSVVSTRFSAL